MVVNSDFFCYHFLVTLADYDNALISLIAEVARTYTSIRTYQVLIRLAHQHIQLQSDGLQVAKSRFQNGASPELDVIQATTPMESTLASIPQLEWNLLQSENALSVLLSQPPGTVQQVFQDSGSIPLAPSKVSIVLPAQLLQRRPDIQSAGLLAAAQCTRVGIAKSELYPKIQLSGTIVTQSLAYWLFNRKHNTLPDGIASGNGRIEAELVEVAAKEALRVKEIPVSEGDLVKKGQVLVRLNTETLDAEMAEAKKMSLQQRRKLPSSKPEVSDT